MPGYGLKLDAYEEEDERLNEEDDEEQLLRRQEEKDDEQAEDIRSDDMRATWPDPSGQGPAPSGA